MPQTADEFLNANNSKYVSEFAPSQKEDVSKQATNNNEKIIADTNPSSQEVVYAGILRRFFAVWIDGIIISIALGILLLPAALLSNNDNSSFFTVLETSVRLIIYLSYHIYFIGAKGQTLGKMALGIKVVNKNTFSAPGFMSAFLREIVGKFISSLILGIGYLWAIWDKEKQAWHDKIAGTIVVRT